MKTRIQLALWAALLSIGAHLYLSLHYYPLKFGLAAGQSLCNLNARFDCDAVSASPFSAMFGIPLSVWGIVTNLVLFVLILLSWLEWSEHPERLRRWTLMLSGVTFLTSIVMALISTFLMTNYCLFCIGLYALSAIIYFAYRGVVREPFWQNVGMDIPKLWSESRGILASFVAIPFLAYFTHHMFMQNMGSSQVDRMVREAIQDWETTPANAFVAKPTLVAGADASQAVLTLVEFADFRCSHCKPASYSLNAFVKSHPDVRFEFYAFPLDGACNEKIEHADGLSCRLAATVYCAEKEGKGHQTHDLLFEIQEETTQVRSLNELDIILSKKTADLGLNWESVLRCAEDTATLDAIRSQAKQGGLVDVRGTPTIFANGKQLSGGQLIPVLQGVRERALAQKK